MPSSFPHNSAALPLRADWGDLRHVLAVADSGSVSAAARALGVNHATVLRRIAAFETAIGARLFDRGPAGYAIAPDRLRLIEAAREAALAFETVERLARGAEAQLTGTVRVTSTDSLCVAVLPAVMAAIMGSARGLRIDLVSTNAHVDLARLGADIAVRPAPRLPDDLIGEQAGELGFAVYGAAGGDPGGWLGLRGTLARTNAAAAVGDPPDECAAGADSFVVLREMAAAGLGRAVLPCPLGEGDTRLRRIGPALPGLRVPIWVAAHRDLADSPRLRLLRRRLVAELGRRAPLLRGADPPA